MHCLLVSKRLQAGSGRFFVHVQLAPYPLQTLTEIKEHVFLSQGRAADITVNYLPSELPDHGLLDGRRLRARGHKTVVVGKTQETPYTDTYSETA